MPERLLDFLERRRRGRHRRHRPRPRGRPARPPRRLQLRQRRAVLRDRPPGAEHPRLDARSSTCSHNPSGPIARLAAGPYVVVVMSGSFDFLGFAQGSGVAGIGLSTGAGGTTVPVRLRRRVLDRRGRDRARVPGQTARSRCRRQGVFIDVHVELNADITSLFHLDVSGDLRSTRARPARTTTTSGSRSAAGSTSPGSISVRGGIEIRVGGPSAMLAFDSPAAPSRSSTPAAPTPGASRSSINKLTGDFGPAQIHLDGFIQSDGQFGVNADRPASTSASTGSASAARVGAGASLIKRRLQRRRDRSRTTSTSCASTCRAASAWRLFGIGIARLQRHRDGQQAGSARRSRSTSGPASSLLFFDACGDFDLFDIQLPASIVPAGPPKLAQFATAGSSVLELNVGANADRRRADLRSITAESYRRDPAQRRRREDRAAQRVRARRRPGRSSAASRSITGDFGTDNDTFVMLPGATHSGERPRRRRQRPPELPRLRHRDAERRRRQRHAHRRQRRRHPQRRRRQRLPRRPRRSRLAQRRHRQRHPVRPDLEPVRRDAGDARRRRPATTSSRSSARRATTASRSTR